MLRTCDRCGVNDDYYMMYFGFNKDNVVNVICDECAMNHKNEYTKIFSVHTMSILFSPIEDKVRKEILNDNAGSVQKSGS